MKLQDKVCLITGGASGIGRHLAIRCVQEGAQVLVTDINTDALEGLVQAYGWSSEQVRWRRLDVREPEAWDAAVDDVVEAWGRLDVALNVAGYLRPGLSHEACVTDIDRHLDINIKGVILGTRAAARHMVTQGHGRIINMGSLASLAPVPGLSLYSTSKFAVRGFSLAVAQELAPYGVKVTVVLPDAVRTPMLDLQADDPHAALTFSGPQPLTVEQVGDLIVGPVLERHPMEIALPLGRGLLARMANLVPSSSAVLAPLLRHRGTHNQARYTPSHDT
ncbi:MAG: SDR family oxidoreductase [Myxococcota bacterium]